jgi:hypothetical protein
LFSQKFAGSIDLFVLVLQRHHSSSEQRNESSWLTKEWLSQQADLFGKRALVILIASLVYSAASF